MTETLTSRETLIFVFAISNILENWQISLTKILGTEWEFLSLHSFHQTFPICFKIQSQWFAFKSVSLSCVMIILYLSLLILLYPSTTTFSVVGHAGTVSGMYVLHMNRPFSHCVLIGVPRYFFQSFFIAPFSSCVELTFLFVQEKNILANVLLLWYTQAKEDLHCKLFSYSHLPISFILKNLLRVHFWTQDLDFSFCLSFGVLLTT